MLSLKILDDIKTVKYSEDESYDIRFTTSDEWRLEAGRQAILPSDLFSDSEKTEVKEPEEQKGFNLFTEFVNSALNTELVVNIACKAVRDWEGIKDSKGNDLQCTDENKRIVFKAFANRARFIYDKTLNESLFSDMEGDLKN